MQQELADFDAMLQVVLTANQPNVTEEGDYSALEAIRQRVFVDPDGQQHALLTDREVQMLSLRRGNLTPQERQEIEKHVTHSFNFLRTIPWTRDLARVPDLAGRHHEKLDGSGYPQGLAGDDIPLGTRMMTIADIFDALVARDRPYKKALPLERALSILEAEARVGKLDTILVQLWIEARRGRTSGRTEFSTESWCCVSLRSVHNLWVRLLQAPRNPRSAYSSPSASATASRTSHPSVTPGTKA